MSLSDVFKALSDPSRRQILRMLTQGDLPAGEIAAAFTISKPSVSHHLAVLKQAGLVEDRRSGQQVIYSLNTTVFDEVVGWVMDFAQSGRGDDRVGRQGRGTSEQAGRGDGFGAERRG
ncbi:autorepressor SdpR family transcription factor [Limnochorda pilosa]|uniref:ArsR family transcriptional regulator n=1 Tax=Limnochorda pilosa TaxID=1555112 RepID=A0A0K2SGD0_LIMPI|nr:autorepressor SdpR family transcription factor [Limnochorda pilosa]BAS25909.1 ArsR family transcriptional regulator [Limnochorda pilosa]